MLHITCSHTNPCRPNSIGLTKHLGNTTFLWKSLQIWTKKLWGVRYNRSCTPYNTYTSFHQIILGTTNIPHSFPNKLEAHYICPFTSHHHAFTLLLHVESSLSFTIHLCLLSPFVFYIMSLSFIYFHCFLYFVFPCNFLHATRISYIHMYVSFWSVHNIQQDNP
jgi:hypothetical protein